MGQTSIISSHRPGQRFPAQLVEITEHRWEGLYTTHLPFFWLSLEFPVSRVFFFYPNGLVSISHRLPGPIVAFGPSWVLNCLDVLLRHPCDSSLAQLMFPEDDGNEAVCVRVCVHACVCGSSSVWWPKLCRRCPLCDTSSFILSVFRVFSLLVAGRRMKKRLWEDIESQQGTYNGNIYHFIHICRAK